MDAVSHAPTDEALVTVLVRRRIRQGHEGAFEEAMREFITFALAFPGNLGIHVARPAAATSREYTVVNRFVDQAARRRFTSSGDYRAWMQHLAEHTEGDPHIQELSGLAGWFQLPPTPGAAAPDQLKMALVTFIGVYPLTSTLPPLFSALLPGWHPLLTNVLATGSIVAALTWVVMPLLTQWFAHWLFGVPAGAGSAVAATHRVGPGPLYLLAAIAATSVFWWSGLTKLIDLGAAQAEMAHFGLEPPLLFALGTIALQLGGSLLVILGGRFGAIGAAALGLFTLATIPLAHDYWNLQGHVAFLEKTIVQEHVSVVGGLLLAPLAALWTRRA
jgi:antibiotic biosynthesis monooxygenase (ABM) superfamily enzyme/uncharacterized membrane protein YphA (DoxX/SURF4 family)